MERKRQHSKPLIPQLRMPKRLHRRLSGLFSPVFFAISFAYMELVFHIREFNNASALFPILFAVL